MILTYSEVSTSALLHFVKDELSFDRLYFRDQEFSLLTIAWNVGPAQKVFIYQVQVKPIPEMAMAH